MATLKIRQLIDMAIGTPDPGHVNFNALHCLLNCFAEKLEITNETIDYSKYEKLVFCSGDKKSGHDLRQLKAISSKEKYKLDESEAAASNQFIVLAATKPLETFESTVESIPIETTSIIEETIDAALESIAEIPKSSIQEHVSIETHFQEPFLQVVSSTKSKGSVYSTEKPAASKLPIQELENRNSKMEMAVQEIAIPDRFSTGISDMKDILQLSVEQLLLLTFLTLNNKPDPKQIQQLYAMAQTLSSMRKGNGSIEKRFELDTVASLDWDSLELQLNKNASEEELLKAHISALQHDNPEIIDVPNQYILDSHLCYSTEKILDELMELKGEFFRLTNKVNELSARLLQQEDQRTVSLISEIQEQIRDVKLNTIHSKEQQDRMEIRITDTVQNIDNIKQSIAKIFEEKVDNSELEILLADKVTYSQLQRKVSLDKMLDMQCFIDNKFGEMLRQINESENKLSLIVGDLQNSLGFAAIEGVLKTFREQLDKKVQTLQDQLQKYIDSTNDDCAAAGARVKVLQDLACLSCDTNCVMRTMEKHKVPKLPSAHVSNTLSPLVTYELGSIRKSGIMGYYRRDDFPHSPNAWLKRQGGELTLKKCIPRHAGGQHTTSTAEERIKKVMRNKK